MQSRDAPPPPGQEPPSAPCGLDPERVEAIRRRIWEGAHNQAWTAERVATRILRSGHL